MGKAEGLVELVNVQFYNRENCFSDNKARLQKDAE